MKFILKNVSTGVFLAERVTRARSPIARIVGWLMRSSIAPDEGILFEHCSAVHTLGMRAAIDIIFLDRDDCVREIAPHVTPGQTRVGCLKATKVLEMGAGFLETCDILIGDRLSLASPYDIGRALSPA